ncbi:MAG: inactive transglutaminase family protein [Legionella sp.]|nr:inactive transglutaminase family protein [Legionella sp.]
MNNHHRHVYGLILCLTIVGLSLFLYRHYMLNVPLTNTETVNSWTLEANVRFVADRNTPVKVTFTVPYLPPYFAILDEYFISHSYGVTTSLNGYNRETVWSIRRAKGDQSLYYRAIVREVDNDEPNLSKPPPVKAPLLTDNEKTAVDNISQQARLSSADIQTFTQSILTAFNKEDGNTRLLLNHQDTEEAMLKAVIAVLNQSKIFAMPIRGLYLNQLKKTDLKYFLAVFNGQDWIYLNPHTGSVGLPRNFLVWQYGFETPMTLKGGSHLQFNLSASPTPVNALYIAKTRGVQTNSQLLRFSLLELPMNVQETYKVLLTVPLGAFIILILRNFIGLKTFGTFMPVLIALAFRESHVLWSMALFILIIAFGLLTRFYLDQLRLLLVPRLAAILTIVILMMIAISVFSQTLGLEAGLAVALFPMVILTMTIERMCITWDERGASEALKSGFGSLLAALIAFVAMSYGPLQYLMFAFPELLLVLLALILWFGQYRGYRLIELLRFKAIPEVNS